MLITIVNIIFNFLQNCTDNEIVLFPFPEGLHNNHLSGSVAFGIHIDITQGKDIHFL